MILITNGLHFGPLLPFIPWKLQHVVNTITFPQIWIIKLNFSSGLYFMTNIKDATSESGFAYSSRAPGISPTFLDTILTCKWVLADRPHLTILSNNNPQTDTLRKCMSYIISSINSLTNMIERYSISYKKKQSN